jgi:hypothetical protein
MSFIIYGGVKYYKKRHAIMCKKCFDTIESVHQHDFKYCSCKLVGIDGDRILGNILDMEDGLIKDLTILTYNFFKNGTYLDY